MGEFFAEEIADPLDLRFHIRLQNDTVDAPIAELDDFNPLRLLLHLDTMP